jgi:protein SCO1/2
MKSLRFFRSVLCGSVFLLLAVAADPAQGQTKVPAPASANSAAPAKNNDAVYRGGSVSPPLPKPKFTLTDTSGAPYDLVSKTQGYATLLFFGYTHCPDMCPLQMSMIAAAFKKLPPGTEGQFKVIFVTTDPDRDTPQVLRQWLDHFDERFIGLTGSQAAVDAAQIAANLAPAKKSPVRADGAYEVGHAAFVLAYTKDNFAHLIYPVGMSLDDWTHDLPALPTETWKQNP